MNRIRALEEAMWGIVSVIDRNGCPFCGVEPTLPGEPSDGGAYIEEHVEDCPMVAVCNLLDGTADPDSAQ